MLSKLKSYFNGRSERSQIVVKNAAGSLAIKVLAMAIDFAKVPVLLTFLDTSHYGVYITIASIVAWTHQFDFGLGSGLRFKLTEAISKHDEEHGKQLVSTAYLSMSAIMLGVLLICTPIILNLNWTNILNCDFIGLPELVLCVCMVLAVFVVQFVLELISVVLQADQKAAVSNIFKPLANLLTVVVILVMRQYAHNSLLLACLAMTVPIVVVLFLANIILFARRYRVIAPSFKDFRKERIRDIYSLGLKYFAGQFSTLVVFSTASFLLSHYVNPTEAAVYNTAWTYFGVVVLFNSMVLTPLVAAVTDAFVKGEEAWIKNIFNKIRLYSCFLTLASLVLLAVSQIVFHLWVGEKIIVPWSLSIVMTLYFICNIWITPYKNFLSGVGKMNVLVVVSFVKIALFFPVAIAFIKHWNSMGLIFAILLVNTLPNMIVGIYQYHLIITHKAKGIWNK
jgi:O-antigen/teichoic acid export membrane protein